ncbi:hypothetical protein FNF27_07241 [Cafeteria roenbergensis]|uniref:Uncharacterized protein n=1 Tax=Cafeteria roenbergensis TaxID=33653 RepID=A0A5A8CDL0_CAFRO|nr:hypothetical protein FNF29_05391 [Cafeteria roenbergensis]KAA0164482.1 hypothetical protein FNF31_02406 [Cafeteria roenbergensis]KAA0167679.1 hypothetical protein FNF27_07241 [Cafeteria roenbergensis]KAA0170042.1 hypothetical protein FNF28_01651 [Cafeteria roenbergensis]|eukprot:KAA0150150.1 hypothetical protein FNF29_05391 [Cafeteria roenbergensis]
MAAAHERLFATTTGHLRAELRAAAAPPPQETPGEAAVRAANKSARVQRVSDHGLVIVQYPTAKVDNKQDTELTSRGKCRTVSGGFFSS